MVLFFQALLQHHQHILLKFQQIGPSLRLQVPPHPSPTPLHPLVKCKCVCACNPDVVIAEKGNIEIRTAIIAGACAAGAAIVIFVTAVICLKMYILGP